MCCILTRILKWVIFAVCLGFGFFCCGFLGRFGFGFFLLGFFPPKLGLVKHIENTKSPTPISLFPKENCSIVLAIFKHVQN